MLPRQEKAPATQQALTVRTLTVVAVVAATVVTGSIMPLLLGRLLIRR
jgi:hypothetical protein